MNDILYDYEPLCTCSIAFLVHHFVVHVQCLFICTFATTIILLYRNIYLVHHAAAVFPQVCCIFAASSMLVAMSKFFYNSSAPPLATFVEFFFLYPAHQPASNASNRSTVSNGLKWACLWITSVNSANDFLPGFTG